MASYNIAQEDVAARQRGLLAAIGKLTSGRLSLNHLWLLIAVAAPFVMLSRFTVQPYDFWWHIRMGQVSLATGHIPTTDFFTFTQTGQPWMNQSWLMQIVLYLLYRAGELPLVIFAHAVTITAGYTLVMLACLATPGVGARAAALATVCAAALGVMNWNVRPQSASFLCFGLLMYSIERHRLRGGRVIWIWPVLFALWANLHGAFVFGLALLGIYMTARAAEDIVSRRRLGQDTERAVIASGVAVLATALNPAGPSGMVDYVLGFLSSKATINNNLEFLPLSIRELDGAIFVGLMIAFILLASYRRTRLSWYQIATLVIFGVGSLYTRRVLPWFGMALTPAFALALASCQDRPTGTHTARPGKPLLNYTVATLLFGVVLLFVPWFRPFLPGSFRLPPYADVATTPTRAAEIVCQLGRDTRLFNNQAYGSYLAWACPSMPLFIDTRIELYPTDMWQDYIRIVNAGYDWNTLLKKYGVNTLFVQKESERELISAARASGEWTMLYEDEYAALMQRTKE